MKKLLSFTLLLTLLLATTSCTVGEDDAIFLEESSTSLMKQLSNPSLSKGLPQPPIWADGILYSGIVAKAKFKPESDPFDELYVMPDGDGNFPFKGGVPLISDSKPGDQDYNGGRWHLNVLKEGVDPAKYSGASSDTELDSDDFNYTNMYFSCPLRPRKN